MIETSTLKTLQAHFQHFLLDTLPDIRQDIATPYRGSATVRLGIYGEGYFLRLLEALSAEFPALKKFMGQTNFEKMAYAYLESHPSHSFSVRYIGMRLPSFLATYDPARPYLRELALFETALSHALDAANAPTKTLQALGEIAPEQWGLMRFTLHPSVSFLCFEWDIPALWETATKKLRKKPVQKPTQVTVWRKGIMPYYSAMDERESRMWQQLENGETFADMCQALASTLPEDQAAQRAATHLAGWIKDDMISNINLS